MRKQLSEEATLVSVAVKHQALVDKCRELYKEMNAEIRASEEDVKKFENLILRVSLSGVSQCKTSIYGNITLGQHGIIHLNAFIDYILFLFFQNSLIYRFFQKPSLANYLH